MYIRHDCLSQDGTGDGAEAWRLLQQRYSNVEKPTVVSLVRQLSRLQLGEEEKLHEYIIRSQELISRLTDAGEKMSETLSNALVINGLPEKYEHYVVQESFNPASIFTELRKLHLIPKCVMSVETQEILQNNVTKEALQLAPIVAKEVIWLKPVEILRKWTNLREKMKTQQHLIPNVLSVLYTNKKKLKLQVI